MKCNPVILKSLDDEGQKLNRIYAAAGDEKDEAWLQNLLYQHPELLPVDQFDEGVGPLISLGCEVPTESGPIDNLFVGPRGTLTIVETKLWKNPEKHRTVVAQIIDYAKDVARWDFHQLCEAVAKSESQEGRAPLSPFEKLQCAHPNISRHEFEERVTMNLRHGRFLLLIVGDRISPNITLLTQAIKTAPGLGFMLGLVEMQFYSLPGSKEWPVVVVPEVVGRTVEETRGIIRIIYQKEEPRVQVEVAGADPEAPDSDDGPDLDETVFFTELRKDLAEPYRAAMNEWKSMGGTLNFTPQNLFFEIELAGEERWPIRCDTDRTTVIMRKHFDEWSKDASLWEAYLAQIARSTIAANTVMRNKHFLSHERLKAGDVQVILQSAIALVKAIRAAEPADHSPIADNASKAPAVDAAPHLDETLFFNELRKDLAEPYRTAMEQWKAMGGTLYFSPQNLFFEIELDGERQWPIRCNPSEITVVKRRYFDELSADASLWEKYRKQIGQSPIALETVEKNKYFLSHERLKPLDVQVILRSAFELIRSVQARFKGPSHD